MFSYLKVGGSMTPEDMVVFLAKNFATDCLPTKNIRTLYECV